MNTNLTVAVNIQRAKLHFRGDGSQIGRREVSVVLIYPANRRLNPDRTVASCTLKIATDLKLAWPLSLDAIALDQCAG